MTDFYELGSSLFGRKRAETNSVLSDGTTHTYVGTATTDSEDGSVMVELSEDVTNPEPVTIGDETFYEDADTSVELPTTANVKAGDDVLVTVYGGTPLRSPVVTGVVGSGDRIATDAEAAREIAEATGQHFWDADDGAHVTELARPDWETQQTGPNSLWNSLGMLFRDGLTNLLALIAGTQEADTFIVTDEYGGYDISEPAISVYSVEISGEELPPSSWWIEGDALILAQDVTAAHLGEELQINYRTSPQLSFFDGLGNALGNVAAEITSSGASFAKGFAFDKFSSGLVDFFGGRTSISSTHHPIRLPDGTIERVNNSTTISTSLAEPGEGELRGVALAKIEMDQAVFTYRDPEAALRLGVDTAGPQGYGSAYLVLSSSQDNPHQSEIWLSANSIGLETDTAPATQATFTMQQVISAIPVELFSGTYAQTVNTSITLSETAANFSRLDILYEDSSGSRNSVTVSDPNGKLANCLMAVMTGTPYYYLKAKTYLINGTTIAVQDMGSYQRQGTARIGNNVATQANFNNEIGIVKVYGYR